MHFCLVSKIAFSFFLCKVINSYFSFLASRIFSYSDTNLSLRISTPYFNLIISSSKNNLASLYLAVTFKVHYSAWILWSRFVLSSIRILSCWSLFPLRFWFSNLSYLTSVFFWARLAHRSVICVSSGFFSDASSSFWRGQKL